MPIHDWSRIPAGIFHHFHQHWSAEIASKLNQGNLPKGLSALIEQRAGPKEGDVLTVEARRRRKQNPEFNGGMLTRDRPITSIVRKTTKQIYAARANRIAIR